MFKFINPYAFFISLFIGLMYVYMFTPSPEIIIKYPTPDNTENIRFKDRADNCYKYKTTEIDCLKNKDLPVINILAQ